MKRFKAIVALLSKLIIFAFLTACSGEGAGAGVGVDSNEHDYIEHDMEQYHGNSTNDGYANSLDSYLTEDEINAYIEAFIEEYMHDVSHILHEDSVHFYYNIGIEWEKKWESRDSDLTFVQIAENELNSYKAMYRDLNYYFDYFVLTTQHLDYFGYFDRDVKFSLFSGRSGDFRNDPFGDTYVTLLNTVMLGRTLQPHFDEAVYIGRNFIPSDFYVDTMDDTVSVVLGYEYMRYYDIGDIETWSFLGVEMNFEIVGFFKQGTQFSHPYRGFEYILFDYAIIVPLFEIYQPPRNEQEIFTHHSLFTMKVGGSIRISDEQRLTMEDFEDTASFYRDMLQEIASRHGLYFDLAILPIPIHNPVRQG